MRTAFTKALYYPSIDIDNVEWLKSALLFWDEIQTIVPEFVKVPYRSVDTQYLEAEGFLSPFIVSSNHSFVRDASDKMTAFLAKKSKDELARDLRIGSRGYRSQWGISTKKMTWELRKNLESYLYSEGIINDNNKQSIHANFDESVYIPDFVAMFYMTLLANKICKEKSIALVSDNKYPFGVAEAVRLGERSEALTQGMLLEIIVQSVQLSPDASLPDIIDFKKRHMDELGRFRTTLAKLTQRIEKDKPLEAIQQELQDIYTNEFLPSYNDLLKALSGLRINYFANNFLKTTFVSTSATSLPMLLAGQSVPHALLASVGVTVLASAVQYHQEKKKMLRETPYSYLLLAQKEFH